MEMIQFLYSMNPPFKNWTHQFQTPKPAIGLSNCPFFSLQHTLPFSMTCTNLGPPLHFLFFFKTHRKMGSTIVVTKYRNILGRMPLLPFLTDRLFIRQLLIPGLLDVPKFHTFFAHHQELKVTTRAITHLTDTRNGSLCLGIFLQKLDKSESELVGLGGVRDASTQGIWPIVSWHFLHPEHKINISLGTEFIRASMEFWWSIPEEAAEFLLEVPANSVGYPQRDGIKVAPRVLASAPLDDTTTPRILAEAGFKKYFVGLDEDGLMMTHWWQINTTTSQLEAIPASRSSSRETQGEAELSPRESTNETYLNINDADSAHNITTSNTGAKTLQQQSPELQPTTKEITKALWHMLAEDVERNKLDVFKLPSSCFEGCVPFLSKKYGVALENRRGQIWTAFETREQNPRCRTHKTPR